MTDEKEKRIFEDIKSIAENQCRNGTFRVDVTVHDGRIVGAEHYISPYMRVKIG